VRLGACLVDVDGATVEVLFIERFDGLAGIVVTHLNETETAGAASVTIKDNVCSGYGTVLGEHFDEIVITNTPRQISNKKLHGKNLRTEQSQEEKNSEPACDIRLRALGQLGRVAYCRSTPVGLIGHQALEPSFSEQSGLKALFGVLGGPYGQGRAAGTTDAWVSASPSGLNRGDDRRGTWVLVGAYKAAHEDRLVAV